MLGAALWSLGLLGVITILVTLNARLFAGVRVIHLYGHTTAALAAVCMVAGFYLVRAAIRPLEALRRHLADVRSGSERRLKGRYPSEVQPLVDDLNGLLAHNDALVMRANARAGDLAHGLKTPLAILANEAGALVRTGDARARLDAGAAGRVDAAPDRVSPRAARGPPPRVPRLTRSARSPSRPTACAARCARLHASRGVRIDLEVDPAHVFHGRREDLDEMLGNLLDNGCKWAASRVALSSSARPDGVTIVVDDDGPGLDPSLRDRVLQRGVRADEAAPGSGLGLAIVRDIAELYGGTIALSASPLGGLRAELSLP